MNSAARTATLAASLLTLTAAPSNAQPAPTHVDSIEREAPVRETVPDTTTVRPGRRHRRMAVEALAIQAIGTGWYWRNTGDGWGESNRVDWQLGFEGSALTNKLGFDRDGWRFDGNSFALNAICHPAFGALTYWAARKNHYSVAESFAISTLISGTWELFTEWAEYGSINDALSTSTTGIALGEAAYQLMHHWRRARYQVAASAGSQAGDAVMATGIRVALDTTPATGDGTFVGGQKVSASLEGAVDGQGMRGVESGVKSSLAGYYKNGESYRLFAGASTEFYYRDQAQRDSRAWDMVATVTAGPTVDAQLRRGDVTVDVGLDVYADFGMLKAVAHDRWRAANPMATVRNSMQGKTKPYYYARGLTIDPRVNVGYRGVNVGGKLVVSRFDSLDGADRDQEMMTADPHMVDVDATAHAWLGYTHGNVAVTLDGRVHERSGTMAGARAETHDRTTMLTVSLAR